MTSENMPKAMGVVKAKVGPKTSARAQTPPSSADGHPVVGRTKAVPIPESHPPRHTRHVDRGESRGSTDLPDWAPDESDDEAADGGENNEQQVDGELIDETKAPDALEKPGTRRSSRQRRMAEQRAKELEAETRRDATEDRDAMDDDALVGAGDARQEDEDFEDDAVGTRGTMQALQAARSTSSDLTARPPSGPDDGHQTPSHSDVGDDDRLDDDSIASVSDRITRPNSRGYSRGESQSSVTDEFSGIDGPERAEALRQLLPTLIKATDDLCEMLRQEGRTVAWKLNVPTYASLFKATLARFIKDDGWFIEVPETVDLLRTDDDHEDTTAWMTYVLYAANVVALMSMMFDVQRRRLDFLALLDRLDAAYPEYFIPKPAGDKSPDWIMQANLAREGIKIRSRRLMYTLKLYAEPGNDPRPLVEQIFFEPPRDGALRQNLNGNAYRSFGWIDIVSHHSIMEPYEAAVRELQKDLTDEKGGLRDLSDSLSAKEDEILMYEVRKLVSRSYDDLKAKIKELEGAGDDDVDGELPPPVVEREMQSTADASGEGKQSEPSADAAGER